MAIRLRVPKPELFSFAEAMQYTTRGFDDPRYVVGEECISTAIAGSPRDTIMVMRVSDEPETLAVEVLRDGKPVDSAPPADAPGIERYVRRWFDLDRDLTEREELVRQAPEPVRSAFSRLLGFRLVALPSLFEALSWCVIGQQINLAFAYTLKRRP